MTTKEYPHGTTFQETFTVTLRGEVIGQPVGWGCEEHEKNWLEDQLHQIVRESLASFYQCKLEHTRIEVKVR